MVDWVRRTPRWLWFALGAVALTFLVLSWRWMLRPASSSVEDAPTADAVVMFAGGRRERLATSLALVDAGKAAILVIPNGTTPGWGRANRLCADPGNIEVHCPDPDPDNTRGEARVIALLAEEQGWESLLLVTSTYHVSRAELLLDRCFDGTVTPVAASPDLDPVTWMFRVGHEWLGHAEARLLARGC